MNEKYLWELWQKCKHPHPKYGGEDMVWPIEFAELIVRECLDILDRNNPRPPGTVILYSMDQDQHFDTGWQVAVETKQERIKQHFGLQE